MRRLTRIVSTTVARLSSIRRSTAAIVQPLEPRQLLSGNVDTTFASGGDFASQYSGYDPNVAIQADGKALLTGFETYPGSLDVQRLNADGSIDTSFGTSGVASVPIQYSGAAAAAAVESNGQIIVVGGVSTDDKSTEPNMVVASYNADGSVDTSFGQDGFTVLQAQSYSSATTIALQPDGKILVAGTAGAPGGTSNGWLIARFNTDGSLDTTFGNSGVVTLSASQIGQDSDGVIGLAVDASGNIYADGSIIPQEPATASGAAVELARLLPSGALDPSFGSAGIAHSAASDYAYAGNLALQADGKVVVAAVVAGNASEDALLRFNTDGSTDTSFGTGGTVTTGILGGWQPRIALAANGQIILSDRVPTQDSDTGNAFGLERFNTTGTLDATFGVDGLLPHDAPPASAPDPFQSPYNGDPANVAVAPSGDIVQVGINDGNNIAASRFNPTATAPGSISGYVYDDANSDGTFDANDPPLDGQTIFLDLNGNGVLDPGEPSTITAVNGSYAFTGVPSFEYLLTFQNSQNLTMAGGNKPTLTVDYSGSTSTYPNENFGVVGDLGVVQGSLFHDDAGNGANTGDTSGQAGFVVFADANGDGQLDDNEVSTTVDASGNFSLALTPGSYTIREEPRTGWVQTYPDNTNGYSVSVRAGGNYPGLTFGNYYGVIGGRVSGDITGGPPTAGQTIYLDANNNSTLDSGELSTTTGSGGAYAFTNVPAGAYIIRQVLPTGYTQTSPSSDYGIHITVTNGGTFTNENFTDKATAPPPTGGSVSGTVTGGACGETIYLDANNNSTLDSGEFSTTTAANGAYSFTNVPAGAYIIRQLLPSGYTQTTPSGGFGHHITVTNGGSITGENFTDQASAPAPTGETVTGTVTNGKPGETIYLDANNNSTLDSGELSTTLSATDTFSFTNVPGGAYIIRQVLPTGYKQTSPSSGYGIHITVTNGGTLTNENFTDTAPVANTASIAGTIFNDANGNGIDDTNETGLAGWTVYLDLNNGGAFVDGDPTATTDSSGDYLFSDLAAGSYIVRVERPSGYTQTSPANNLGHHITVSSDQASTGVSFGEEKIA